MKCPECEKEVDKVVPIHSDWTVWFARLEQEYWCEECLDKASEAAYDRFLDKYYGG